MRFAHVTGILYTEADGFRIEVTLDTRRTIETVRSERVPALLYHGGRPDPDWTVDQLTQETIGTTLAEQGWEAIAMAEPTSDDALALPVAVYVVRG